MCRRKICNIVTWITYFNEEFDLLVTIFLALLNLGVVFEPFNLVILKFFDQLFQTICIEDFRVGILLRMTWISNGHPI